MTWSASNKRGSQMDRVASFLRSEFAAVWAVWSYNPGRHYMRGPGPKWRQKHTALRVADMQGELAMRIDGSGRIISSH
jgi:hypothetical protein